MKIDALRTLNFRNLFSGEVEADSENIVLTGKNGQGKTNVLEAVYALCYGGSSFRTPYLRECITYGEDFMGISASYTGENGEKGVLELSQRGRQRRITLDGKEIRDRKELIYLFPCIVFCHDDISFIKGEPDERRKFFNQLMSLHDPSFLDSLRLYNGVLMQRNAAIRSGDPSLVSLYDSRLASYGMEIMEKRSDAVYGFNRIFPDLYKSISESDTELHVEYQPSWNEAGSTGEIEAVLEKTRERDMNMGTTTSGIHRDRFTLMCPYGQFSQSGSTGQLRLSSIIFRMAEAMYFTQKTGRLPVLLIDDVLLELDIAKRGRVLSSLPSYSQAWYTFLPGEDYSYGNRGRKTFVVEGGKLIG